MPQRLSQRSPRRRNSSDGAFASFNGTQWALVVAPCEFFTGEHHGRRQEIARPADAARINVNEEHELRYWTKAFGVTEQKLRAAVASAALWQGTSAPTLAYLSVRRNLRASNHPVPCSLAIWRGCMCLPTQPSAHRQFSGTRRAAFEAALVWQVPRASTLQRRELSSIRIGSNVPTCACRVETFDWNLHSNSPSVGGANGRRPRDQNPAMGKRLSSTGRRIVPSRAGRVSTRRLLSCSSNQSAADGCRKPSAADNAWMSAMACK